MSGLLHQASCVAIHGPIGKRALLIEGPAGSGKSSLALALIDRGAELVGDDGVRLDARDAELWAAPPHHTAGMLEIRNVGIVEMESVQARVALVLRLDPDAPRYAETPEVTYLAGIELPLLRLWPHSPVLALRAEWALRLYGT